MTQVKPPSTSPRQRDLLWRYQPSALRTVDSLEMPSSRPEAGLPLAYEGTVGSKQEELTPKEYRDFVVSDSSDNGLTTEMFIKSGFPFPLLLPFLGFALISTVFMVILLVTLSASHTLRGRKLLVRRFGAYQGLMVSTAGALLAAIGGSLGTFLAPRCRRTDHRLAGEPTG